MQTGTERKKTTSRAGMLVISQAQHEIVFFIVTLEGSAALALTHSSSFAQSVKHHSLSSWYTRDQSNRDVGGTLSEAPERWQLMC